MTKYIFLDFDGVLNTDQYKAQCNVLGLSASDKYGPLFDPRTVSNLQRLIDETGAEVVIISSWRYVLSNQKLREMWKDRGLPQTTIHVLDPKREMKDLSKGEQIYNFMSGRLNSPYIILDDEYEFLDSQMAYLIHINPIVGLKETTINEAIRRLTSKNELQE